MRSCRPLLFALLLPALACGGEPRLIRLTQDGHFKQRPAFSPDGSKVVFARHVGATIHLFLLDLAATPPVEQRLTEGDSPEYDAVFSPDGRSLLYAFDKTSPNQGDIEVYRTSLEDRKPIPVVTTGKTLSHEESPGFSPDGKRLAFTSTRDGNQELYVADTDGQNVVRLTSDPAIDAHPAWSPDGSAIAFSTNRWGDLEIALITPDGTGLKRLTQGRGLDDYPAWSPDGMRLAFASNRDGNLEIYTCLADGSGLHNVSQAPTAVDNFPAWTPDGRLGFISNRDGGFDLYVTF